MNKFYLYLISYIIFFICFLSILEIPIPSKISEPRILDKYEIILFLLIGIILFIYTKYFYLEKKEKYTKCPKCKEVFNYNELKDGKCKNCKEIDTIDLDKYFEKYPNELKEKTKNVNNKEQ